jgi:hypothetical protein
VAAVAGSRPLEKIGHRSRPSFECPSQVKPCLLLTQHTHASRSFKEPVGHRWLSAQSILVGARCPSWSTCDRNHIRRYATTSSNICLVCCPVLCFGVRPTFALAPPRAEMGTYDRTAPHAVCCPSVSGRTARAMRKHACIFSAVHASPDAYAFRLTPSWCMPSLLSRARVACLHYMSILPCVLLLAALPSSLRRFRQAARSICACARRRSFCAHRLASL